MNSNRPQPALSELRLSLRRVGLKTHPARLHRPSLLHGAKRPTAAVESAQLLRRDPAVHLLHHAPRHHAGDCRSRTVRSPQAPRSWAFLPNIISLF